MTYIWLAVFVAAVIIEIATCALLSVWFACGAVVAMICAMLGASLMAQIAVFICISIICLFFFVIYLKKNIEAKRKKTNLDSLIHASAVVEEEITERGKGRVMVSSMSWLAEEENGKKIESGEWVEVIEIKGATLVVRKTKN